MVDANGVVANHTGDKAIKEHCNLTGEDCQREVPGADTNENAAAPQAVRIQFAGRARQFARLAE